MVIRTLKGKCLFAIATVLMMLSAPVAAMAIPDHGAAATFVTSLDLTKPGVRAYVDGSDWPGHLNDAARTGHTSSPLPASNDTIWSVDLSTTVPTSPVVSDGLVIVATAAGVVKALNASTGAETWSSALGSPNPSTAAIWAGHLVVGTSGGDLFSLNITNGTQEWEVNIGGAANTTPLVANGVAYVGTGANKVWAYNITDGKHLWNKTIGGPVKFGAALSSNVLVVASGNLLQAMNATNGNPVWSNTTAGTEVSGPSITGASSQTFGWLTYVTSNDAKLYAFNMTDGGLRWSSAISYGKPLTPTINGPIVLTSGSDRVQGFNYSNGNRFWNLTIADGPAAPAVIGNWTLMAASKNMVTVADFGTGSAGPVKWAYDLKNGNVPALAYGRAFVSTTDGKVVAFGHSPTSIIDSIAPDPVPQGQTLTLKGHGSDASAFTNYRWSSDIDGPIVEGPTKATTVVNFPLSIGQHVITFEVQDDNWTWSAPVQGQVTVVKPLGWPMFRGNTDRTGESAGKVPAINGTKWIVDLTGPGENQDIQSSPVVLGDTAFIGSRDFFIHALNMTTGETRWSYKTGGSVDSTPAVSNGYIIFGSDDRRVYCMDADPSDGIDEGIIDFGAPYDLIWTFETNGPVWSSPTVLNNVAYVTTSPAVDNQNPNPGRLYALSITSGANRELWHFTLPNNAPSYSSPVVSKDLVIFGANDNRLYAVNRWTGKEEWNFSTGSSILSSPTIYNGLAIFGSNDWKVYAVYLSNGTQAWTKSTGGEVKSSPAINNNVVYVGSFDNKLYALNATSGAQLWTYTTQGGIWSSPTIAQDQVAFGSFDGFVHIVNTTTHALTWKRGVVAVAQSSPAIVEDTILIGAANGYIYAFGKAPDLSVESKDVTLSLSTPQVGIPITIFATITNKGTITGNGTVDFFDSPDYLGSAPIELDPGNSTTVSVQWIPSTPGFHQIIVNITGIKPHDSNILNNRVIKPYTVLAQTEGWRMFQKDPQHTGNADFPAPNNNKVLWSYNIQGQIKSSPVIADQLLYMGTANGIYALVENPGGATGILQWSNTSIKNIEATPAIVNGVLYVTSTDGAIYAIDAWTGKTLWSSGISAGTSSPVVHNGTVFVGTSDGKLLALWASNGTTAWEKLLGGHVLGSPAVFDDRAVIAANSDGAFSKVVSINMATGGVRWEYPTGFEVAASPSIDGDGYVYISDTNGTVYKFEAVPDFKDDGIPNTGNYDLIWTYEAKLPIRSSAAIYGTNIFLAAGNTSVLSLTTDGALNWKRAYSADHGAVISSSPAIAQNKMYLGGDQIYCLDRTTGLTVWKYDTPTAVSSSPAVVLGKVFFATDGGITSQASVLAFANITPVTPKAVITSPKDGGNYRIGEQVTFNGSASTDDGVILDYMWDFGDGNTGNGAVITHSYDVIGNYTVTLTVKDNELTPLLNDTAVQIHVRANAKPLLSVVGLSPTQGYDWSYYNFTVTYSDPDNDPPSEISVLVSGIEYPLQKVFNDANDFVGGVRYYCSTRLPSDYHNYQFKASDGVLNAQPLMGSGPKVWRIDQTVQDEITVDMEFVGQGHVVIDTTAKPPDSPAGLLAKDAVYISTEDISEWRWMRLEINGTRGWNITSGIVTSTLKIYWFNGTWKEMDTKVVAGRPIYWLNITSEQAPTLGHFGLLGVPVAENKPPRIDKVTVAPSNRVNVKEKVTLYLSANPGDGETEKLYFRISWNDDSNDQDTGWKESMFNASHKFTKRGTYKVVVWASDDARVLTNESVVNKTHVVSTSVDITVREEGSSEALIILVVVVLVVLAVAFAVPTKGAKDEDEDEEEEGLPDEEEEKPIKGKDEEE